MSFGIWRLAFFILAFTIEIRVRAETAPVNSIRLPLARALLEQPEGCWSESASTCAIRTNRGEKANLEMAGSKLTLDEKTAIIRLSPNEFRLVSGQVWIKSTESLSVKTEFGAVAVESGEFWIDRNSDRVRVGAIRGTARLAPRGSSEQIEVGSGLENWLGRVVKNGESRRGIPVAIDFRSHLERWARLFSGTRQEFHDDAQAFHEEWKAATAAAAEIHKAVFERKVASLRAEHQRSEAAKRKVEARNDELIEMFRKKVFEQ